KPYHRSVLAVAAVSPTNSTQPFAKATDSGTITESSVQEHMTTPAYHPSDDSVKDEELHDLMDSHTRIIISTDTAESERKYSHKSSTSINGTRHRWRGSSYHSSGTHHLSLPQQGVKEYRQLDTFK
ncbi:unnamed protein product, partial [Meganyctiphanes norvegica]